MLIIAIPVATVFFFLSALHFYWAWGGLLGKKVAIPENEGRPLFQPSRTATLLVAFGLSLAGLTVLGRAHFWGESLPGNVFSLGCWILSLLFFLRAVGDLKWVGIFKRKRGTSFATWDTFLFSPLCLGLSLLIAGINLCKR